MATDGIDLSHTDHGHSHETELQLHHRFKSTPAPAPVPVPVPASTTTTTTTTTHRLLDDAAATVAIDYSTIKHLIAEAELHQQQSLVHLATATSILQAAQSQYSMAKSVHDESIAKVEQLKLQYRQQIMEEQLLQPCRWNVMYRKLIEWKESHDGDTTVPCDSKCSNSDIIKLNRWVVNQRTAYKYYIHGDKKHFKEYRVDALNKVSFIPWMMLCSSVVGVRRAWYFMCALSRSRLTARFL